MNIFGFINFLLNEDFSAVRFMGSNPFIVRKRLCCIKNTPQRYGSHPYHHNNIQMKIEQEKLQNGLECETALTCNKWIEQLRTKLLLKSPKVCRELRCYQIIHIQGVPNVTERSRWRYKTLHIAAGKKLFYYVSSDSISVSS